MIPASSERWEKLLFEPGLRGWIAPPRGWRVEDGLLRLERGTSRVRVLTDRGYRNLTLALQARSEDDQAVFGLLLRAQSEERVILLEFRQGRPSLVIGSRVEALDFEWTAGVWHELRVTTRQQDLELLVDGRQAASVKGVSVGGPGPFGMYCQAGAVEFRDPRIQRFPD